MEKIENPSGTITIPHNVYISQLIFDLYNEYNSSTPDPFMDITDLRQMTDIICGKIGVEKKPHVLKSFRDCLLPIIPQDNTKTVVLGFSGGLDSVYQAIDLKERGYFVTLYHLKGINTYENGQASKRCPEIAKKLKMPYVESVISKKRGTQSVPENPLKNELIMSLMIDYCLHWGIQYMSMGDDLNLSITDSVVGVNVTDAREVTEAFVDGVKNYIDIRFLPIMGGEKIDRIKKLMEYGLENDYYSCVQAGRFNKRLHNLNEKKYGVKLFEGNCGCSCRKCAMHNLLMYYSGVKEFPQEFVDKCWEVMWNNSYSADYELFKPELSLDIRIKNLFEY
jgi:hypothetical protein